MKSTFITCIKSLLVILIISCKKVDQIKVSNQNILNGKWKTYYMPDNWRFRDGASLIKLGKKLVMLGGWVYDEPYSGGKVCNEVWESIDGYNWRQLPNAPWAGRHGMGCVVHNGKIYIVGGDFFRDVWSTADCINWVCENENLPFEGRYTPNLASLNGNLIFYAGIKYIEANCPAPSSCMAIGFNDIWSSKDGRNWKKIATAPWKPRGLIHNSVVYRNKIYLIGGGLKQSHPFYPVGETFFENADVWSSLDGINWKLETTNFGISPRTHFSVLSAFDLIWISDGSIHTQENVSNDLFFSKDGIVYTRVKTPDDMPKRHASSFIDFNNELIILGGPPTNFPRNKVYVYSFN